MDFLAGALNPFNAAVARAILLFFLPFSLLYAQYVILDLRVCDYKYHSSLDISNDSFVRLWPSITL